MHRIGDEARKKAEEALKIYRQLAEKEPETYLPHVAITLNNLGIFDSDKDQSGYSGSRPEPTGDARKAFEEALNL